MICVSVKELRSIWASPSFSDVSLRCIGLRTAARTLRGTRPYLLGFALSISVWSATAQITNPSFETPVIATYQYGPTGSGIGWSFANGGGIQHNGGDFGAANAPDGVQTAFLQSTGYMSQSLSLTVGSYQLSFQAARRGADTGTQPIRVKIDGQQIGSLVSPPSTSFGAQAISFSISTTGSHQLRMEGTVQDGTTTFVDVVSVQQVAGPPGCSSDAPSAQKTYSTTGTFRVFAYNVYNTTSMKFPTWGGATQDDVYWYDGVNAGGGTWYADIDLSRHKTGAPEFGTFTTDVYMYGPNGSAACARTTWQRIWPPSCTSAAPSASTTSATWGTFKVYAYNVVDATEVKFPVWADPAQSDLVWYDGISSGGGNWYANVDLARHKVDDPLYGTFTADAYAINPGASVGCARTTWSRVAAPSTCSHVLPAAATTTGTSGPFEICAYGVNNAASVTFPTWGDLGEPNEQDDLVTYLGSHKGGGKYCAIIDLGGHKPGNPEYAKFSTHVHMTNPSGNVICEVSANWTRMLPITGMNRTSGTGVKVTLDDIRGGQVSSIVVPILGETLVSDFDGRGLGTSGFVFNEGPADLWVESGCVGNGHNPDVAFTSTTTSIKGTGLTSTSWDGGSSAGCVLPADPTQHKFKNFQISHTVWFPNASYKAVAVQETVKNLVGIPVTPSSFNQGYKWPIAPQAHFDRTRFIDPAINRGYWRNRQANGTWVNVTVASRASWLLITDCGTQGALCDFYSSPGHALAVYKDAARTSGVAMYCKNLDFGFYALDVLPPSNPIIFIGSVWSFNGVPIQNNASASKTCLVVYGSEGQISAAINGF